MQRMTDEMEDPVDEESHEKAAAYAELEARLRRLEQKHAELKARIARLESLMTIN